MARCQPTAAGSTQPALCTVCRKHVSKRSVVTVLLARTISDHSTSSSRATPSASTHRISAESTSSLNITTPAKLNPPAPHPTLQLAPLRLRGFPLCATHMLYLTKPSPGSFYPHRATLPLNPLFLVIPPMPHGQWKYHFPGEPSQPKATLSLQPATAGGPMGLNGVFFRFCHIRFLLFAGRTP